MLPREPTVAFSGPMMRQLSASRRLPVTSESSEVMTDHFFPAKHLWEPWVRVEARAGAIWGLGQIEANMKHDSVKTMR